MTGCAFRLFYCLEVALFLLAIWIDVTTTHAQVIPSNTSFISIDCGTSNSYYQDEIGLDWVSDATYVHTGENSNPPLVVDPSFANHEALTTFRYFPGSSKRNCYLLPTQSQPSSLIRAMFYHGNSAILQLPIQFGVFINSTYWFTMHYNTDDSENDLNSPRVFEAVIYNPGSINLCLLPTIGISFISSLEVRALEPGMYGFPGRSNAFLSKLIRLNPGAQSDSPSVRYPEDGYDRLWDSPSSTDWTGRVDQFSYTNSTVNNIDAGLNYVPLKVMQDAWMYDNVNKPVLLNWTGLSKILSQQVTTIYTVLYAQEISPNSSTNAKRRFGALLNAGEGPSLNMSAFSETFTGTFYNYAPISDGANLSLAILSGSPLGPILNAVEIYAQIELVKSSTLQHEVDTLDILNQCVNLTRFEGDPCFPVPWDYVGCQYSTGGYLSAYAPDGSVIMYSPDETANVDRINITGLTGVQCPASNLKSGLTNLTELTIVNSDINLTSLQSIVELIKTSDVDSTWSPSLLNLSNNGLAVDVNELLGGMFTFNESLSLLEDLNMSDNDLTGTFPETIFSLPLLQTANFDRNEINGTLNLTQWYNLLQYNINNISGRAYSREYSFVNNSITAIYPDVDILEPVIELLVDSFFQFSYQTYTILLGGNPWCQTSENSLAQQYLCRLKSDDIIKGKKKPKSTLAIALGSSSGALGLLVICLLLAFLYKMRNQMREIHKVLAERKVQPPYFSYRELKLATKNFHHENKLGSGGFGAVYKGVLEDKTVLAVKKLFNSSQVLNEFLNEVVLITGIKHRNLVQLKGCCIEEKQRILVYEYVENGNLADALWGNPKFKNPILPWSDRFNIIVGVARGLAYLHEELQPGIIHRDIKPANVLLDKDCNAKIADFGLARSYFEEQTQANYTSVAGTKGYFAPEYATDGHLTEKADVYSFGIMTLEILSGRKCIDYKQPEDKVFLKAWAQKLRTEDKVFEIVQPELKEKGIHDKVARVINIALLCLQTFHDKRPSMSHVVTMLLGNMDVTVFLEKPQKNLSPEFSGLLKLWPTPTSALGKVNENEEYPLLNVDISFTSGSTSFGNYIK